MTPREKIRQFVIMARHPEAGSYEEAMNMEKKYKNCLYSNPIGKVGEEGYRGVKCYDVNGIYGHFYILGRPITVLDVCWALNKNHDISMAYTLAITKNLAIINHEVKCKRIVIADAINPMELTHYLTIGTMRFVRKLLN